MSAVRFFFFFSIFFFLHEILYSCINIFRFIMFSLSDPHFKCCLLFFYPLFPTQLFCVPLIGIFFCLSFLLLRSFSLLLCFLLRLSRTNFQSSALETASFLAHQTKSRSSGNPNLQTCIQFPTPKYNGG